jgi:hypothetical protein
MGNSSGNIERLKKMRQRRWISLVFPLALCLIIVVTGLWSLSYVSGVKSTMNKERLDEPFFKLLDLIIAISALGGTIAVGLIIGLAELGWKIYTNFAIVAGEIENIKHSIKLPEGESEQKEPVEK